LLAKQLYKPLPYLAPSVQARSGDHTTVIMYPEREFPEKRTINNLTKDGKKQQSPTPHRFDP
jgi:hypothetical protein